MNIGDSTKSRQYRRGVIYFTASRAEMRAWEAKPCWWRMIHRSEAPWNRGAAA